MRHRGPDDTGLWLDEKAGAGLAQARLAILDLSPAGHQPMVSTSGRFVITYNGEIYNYQELRAQLEAIGPRSWRGGSDTEVMLAGFDSWGVKGTLERLVGIFAFGLWDRQERRLYLGRDHVGVKPLYCGWAGRAFAFASELPAIERLPGFDKALDRTAVTAYLRFGYVPAPLSIYQRVRKVMPGTFETLEVREDGSIVELGATTYWSFKDVLLAGWRNPFRGSFEEAVSEVDSLLRRAVKLQLVSDVPVGAFLSGGIDSSTVVAMMSRVSTEAPRTFSIGFAEREWNEAPHAKAIAEHLGTRHTEQYVGPQDALAVIPQLPKVYDEPFADVSQIPTILLSQMTRRDVTVSLSGDGGDELFGGYPRYARIDRRWRMIRKLPLRRPIGALLGAEASQGLVRMLGGVSHSLHLEQRREQAASLLSSRDPEAMYTSYVSEWKEPLDVVRDHSLPEWSLRLEEWMPPGASAMDRAVAHDSLAYLPDDLLAKVDRASMAVGLEARVPILDHRVVEFAATLPWDYKVDGTETKLVLRKVLSRYVPEKLFERPKMGFGVPIGEWTRGPLREWAEGLLSGESLTKRGLLRPEPIRQAWANHLAGLRSQELRVWNVLMLQSWLESRGL